MLAHAKSSIDERERERDHTTTTTTIIIMCVCVYVCMPEMCPQGTLQLNSARLDAHSLVDASACVCRTKAGQGFFTRVTRSLAEQPSDAETQTLVLKGIQSRLFSCVRREKRREWMRGRKREKIVGEWVSNLLMKSTHTLKKEQSLKRKRDNKRRVRLARASMPAPVLSLCPPRLVLCVAAVAAATS